MKVDIYCDGAVKNNGGPGRIGMGAVLLQELNPHHGDKVVSKARYISWSMELERATNIRAELEAIYQSMLLIKTELTDRVDLLIYTDSEWAIRTFSGQYKSTAHRELRQKISDYRQRFKSWSLDYERGHAGHQWQEMSDELASRAAGTWKKAGSQLPPTYEQHELEDE